ncbi:hypothetical protein ACSFA7_10625 [Variovorax sp. LT1R20]|uniref:hypothetical protein n=1 Tax=Variovorax sp. LT1R20 TaxID=3443729 RepID=UPI003F480518
MGLNIAATSLVALASYQLLVRYTPVGTLLNGRRAEKRSNGKPTKARVLAAK